MKIAIVTCLISVSTYAYGQTPQAPQKIGHADWEYIFAHMPQYKQIEKDLKTFEGQLQNQLKQKGEELERKYKAYQSMPADTPDPIRKNAESELAYLQENIQKFQQEAQTSMQKKQSDLINPVFEKVGTAIEEVAREHGFSYIVNPKMVAGGDVLMFADEKYNISDLVLKKLGVEIAKAPAIPSKKD